MADSIPKLGDSTHLFLTALMLTYLSPIPLLVTPLLKAKQLLVHMTMLKTVLTAANGVCIHI